MEWVAGLGLIVGFSPVFFVYLITMASPGQSKAEQLRYARFMVSNEGEVRDLYQK